MVNKLHGNNLHGEQRVWGTESMGIICMVNRQYGNNLHGEQTAWE